MNDRVARERYNALDLYRLARIEQMAGQPKQHWVGTLERARALQDEDLHLDPADGEALSLLALIQTRLGQFKEAQDAIRRSMASEPGNAAVLMNAARVYALQRERVRALDILRRVMNLKYALPNLLDMDFLNLRSDEGFLPAVTG
jgi:Flp pilus assembly protein TadD